MAKRVAVVITEDPRENHRPVEALRIALGLCAGDHDTTVVLLGKAPLLLTDEIDDVIDVDILERYRPSFAQLGIPFVIADHSPVRSVRKEFSIRREPASDIRAFLETVDRALVF